MEPALETSQLRDAVQGMYGLLLRHYCLCCVTLSCRPLCSRNAYDHSAHHHPGIFLEDLTVMQVLSPSCLRTLSERSRIAFHVGPVYMAFEATIEGWVRRISTAKGHLSKCTFGVWSRIRSGLVVPLSCLLACLLVKPLRCTVAVRSSFLDHRKECPTTAHSSAIFGRFSAVGSVIFRQFQFGSAR